MIEKELIRQKLVDIRNYLRELKPLLDIDSRLLIEDNIKLHAFERLFQLIVDTTIDINTHIITRSDFNVPDDYYNTFIVLAQNNVLPMEFALKIAGSVGLRNMVIHKYGNVDIKRMVDDIKSGISDYTEYMQQIEKFLKTR